jgi:hypothetical protein
MKYLILVLVLFCVTSACFAQAEYERVPASMILADSNFKRFINYFQDRAWHLDESCYNDTCEQHTDTSLFYMRSWDAIRIDDQVMIEFYTATAQYDEDSGTDDWVWHVPTCQPIFRIRKPIAKSKGGYPMLFLRQSDMRESLLSIINDTEFTVVIQPNEDYKKLVLLRYRLVKPTKEGYEFVMRSMGH